MKHTCTEPTCKNPDMIICLGRCRKSRMRISKMINLKTGEITYPDRKLHCENSCLDISKYKTRDMKLEIETYNII